MCNNCKYQDRGEKWSKSFKFIGWAYIIGATLALLANFLINDFK